jgi:hypothetical protein
VPSAIVLLKSFLREAVEGERGHGALKPRDRQTPPAVGIAEWHEKMTLLVAVRPQATDAATRKVRLLKEERSHRIFFCARILIDVPVGDPRDCRFTA